MNPQLNNTKNYLVPSSGQTHGVTFSGVFSATPLQVDWRQFAIDNYPFSPQGVFIDNTEGTGPITINFQPLNYNVICPTGVAGQFQFPAVDQQTSSITGLGQCTIVFVDFPVLPNSGLINIGNPVIANVPVNVSGAPYQTSSKSDPSSVYFAVTPSDIVNFTNNSNSLYIGVSGDVVAVTPSGTPIIFKGVPQGAILPIISSRVNATGTTAANIVAL